MAHGVTPDRWRPRWTRRAGRAGRVHRLADLLRDGRRRRGLRRGLPRARRAAGRRPGVGPALRLPPRPAAQRAGAGRRRRAHEHAQDRRLADPERDAARRGRRAGSTSPRVGRAMRLVRSTSQSALLMASLDGARRQLAIHGEALLHETIAAAVGTRARRWRRSPGSRWSTATSSAARASRAGTRCGWSSTCAAPAARATRSPRRCAAPTTSSPSWRRTRRWCSCSASRSRRVVARARGRRPRRDRQADRRAGTATRWSARRSALENEMVGLAARRVPRRRRGRAVDDAVGRVSCESIAGYPPGIPALLPGERITGEAIAYLRELRDAGARLHGASDPAFATIHGAGAATDAARGEPQRLTAPISRWRSRRPLPTAGRRPQHRARRCRRRAHLADDRRRSRVCTSDGASAITALPACLARGPAPGASWRVVGALDRSRLRADLGLDADQRAYARADVRRTALRARTRSRELASAGRSVTRQRHSSGRDEGVAQPRRLRRRRRRGCGGLTALARADDRRLGEPHGRGSRRRSPHDAHRLARDAAAAKSSSARAPSSRR